LDSYLLYQKLFSNSATIDEILELPYNIFNDLILKQIILNKKEKDEIKKLTLKNKNSRNR
jgi:hypothetical protein